MYRGKYLWWSVCIMEKPTPLDIISFHDVDSKHNGMARLNRTEAANGRRPSAPSPASQPFQG
ncbi:hypothetical protein NEUTE1DRAFT_115605 [Neurospora tetrasperma FGSC 2508]|uniref:Uncharacterized protein n=1 Tax=Neurospora tetrasperma (strain FGSC 2508 / ATCC MYA-4615 / P0657) TaxID=510951 RepID=F8MF11_NEUT8|nr:uncharacterized protein NEUTE1DRAFT_115605 [Neurospora tetrasperma FGSC 2508]EGO60063.1 hypothetical protein NEUTE1DRAFT_115605 [Neurospora tetrasperma FGSC 2508]EGZ75986.1 hypothetical protein NEUTE2DRAFT_143879 [Neurospora tetrasperma FGSC 2509]